MTNTNRTFSTLEDIVAVVKPKAYTSKNEWFDKDSGSWHAAKRRGILEEVCLECEIPVKAQAYNPDRPHWVYLVLVATTSGTYIGYGNTARLKGRLRQHRTNAKKVGSTVTMIKSYKFNDGVESRQVETQLKLVFPQTDTGVEGFRTEATDICRLLEVSEFIVARMVKAETPA